MGLRCSSGKDGWGKDGVLIVNATFQSVLAGQVNQWIFLGGDIFDLLPLFFFKLSIIIIINQTSICYLFVIKQIFNIKLYLFIKI